ncbi:MAG: M20/M25/M40 family metallo-hydrolase [Akkermansia muciniphila]
MSDCADWLVDKLSGMGLEAKACKTPLHPIVLARSPREEGKPTVLIYGHYDVQPVDPVELWESDPFEPEVRGGKIYARGATDNKGQLFAHILGVEELLRQNGGHLPVNVIFLLEGEEEVGSGSLSQSRSTGKSWPATLLWFPIPHGRSDTPYVFLRAARAQPGRKLSSKALHGSSFRRVRRSGGQSHRRSCGNNRLLP